MDPSPRRGLQTARVAEKGQEPWRECEKCAFYLLLDRRKWNQWLLTETLNHSRSQEILRTHQGGTNTRASNQCQEAKARDAQGSNEMCDLGEQTSWPSQPPGTSMAQSSAHLSPLLWSHPWLPGADFADTNVISIVDIYRVHPMCQAEANWSIVSSYAISVPVLHRGRWGPSEVKQVTCSRLQ